MPKDKTFNFLYLFILLSVTVPGAMTRHCAQGSLKFFDHCVICDYIPGCASYAQDGSCSVCEYGHQRQGSVCRERLNQTENCCVRWDDEGKCEECAPGLQLDGNSCFKLFRPGCLQGQGQTCHNCAHNYYNRNGKCYKKIHNCRTQAKNGECIQCSKGFLVVNGLCAKDNSPPLPKHCERKNQYGCLACKKGYHLSNTKQCLKDEIGCLKYFQGICLGCKPHFLYENKKCKVQGCSSYKNNQCQSCASNYKLDKGICLIQNCIKSKNGSCLICNPQTRLSNGKCIIPSKDQCQVCAPGYFSNDNGKCVKIILGCKAYNHAGKCLQCKSIFTPFNGTCKIPGCEVINGQKCQKCHQSLTLTKLGECKINHCQKQIDIRCDKCVSGYHVHHSHCDVNDPLCVRYERIRNNMQVCVNCVGEYMIDDQHKCIKRQPGCIYENGICVSCRYPFIFRNSKCVIDGCIQYAIEKCSECQKIYELKEGNCVIEHCVRWQHGKCLQCEQNYHLYESKCRLSDPQCVRYYHDDCIECREGFVLNRDGNCIKKIKYCQVYGSSGCDKCISGYQMSNGLCSEIQINCITYSGNYCVQCDFGYHLNNTKCIINDQYCFEYSNVSAYNQICQKCIEQYYMDDKHTCRKSQLGCIYRDRLCYDCQQPYIYDNEHQTCRIRGCVKYWKRGCSKCAYPYRLENNFCFVENCVRYSSDDQCSKCQPQYTLIQGQCFKKDPHCVKLKGKKCKQCISEYKVFEGVCVKEDKYCEKYSKYGGCRQCKSRYYLSSDYVCLPEEPGCIYQRHKCAYCQYPFSYDKTQHKCIIKGCKQYSPTGCYECRFPFSIKEDVCHIPNCLSERDDYCGVCKDGYHLKERRYCEKDHHSCVRYNDDGDCIICVDGYLPMTNGQCVRTQPHCIEVKSQGKCTSCEDGYFLNRFYHCERRDNHCEEYNNGICQKCQNKYFLNNLNCVSYIAGCLGYKNDQCTKCKQKYQLAHGKCNTTHAFQPNDIVPMSIKQIRNYLQFLSPISKLGKVFYSSFYNQQYNNARLSTDEGSGKGWKSQHQRSGEYVGYYLLDEPVTFYFLQISGVEGNYISQFYLQYSIDGIQFRRISHSYDSRKCASHLLTIVLDPIYARAIRIVVKSYHGWPAARLQFFYYDYLRGRKISNYSLTMLKEAVQGDRIAHNSQNPYEIHSSLIEFNPDSACQDRNVCFTGLELCQAKKIKTLTIDCERGYVSKFYVVYSLDGSNFICFEKCREFIVEKLPYTVSFDGLVAKNLRVYPVQWKNEPKIHISYEYE